jgi:predicted nucleic acid-binding protein
MLGFLRRFAALSELRMIHFLWRPFLHDPGDDMLLELAVAGRATHIVTFNLRHFAEAERVFGIKPVTPGDFLASLPPSP